MVPAATGDADRRVFAHRRDAFLVWMPLAMEVAAVAASVVFLLITASTYGAGQGLDTVVGSIASGSAVRAALGLMTGWLVVVPMALLTGGSLMPLSSLARRTRRFGFVGVAVITVIIGALTGPLLGSWWLSRWPHGHRF